MVEKRTDAASLIESPSARVRGWCDQARVPRTVARHLSRGSSVAVACRTKVRIRVDLERPLEDALCYV